MATLEMIQDVVHRYVRWFSYEQDSHARTLASLNAVNEELRTAGAFQKAVDLMAHIIAARRMWLYRLGISHEPAELFPRQAVLSELTEQLREMEAAWQAYLSGLSDSELARVLEYQSYEGARFRNTIEDILTQLFGHSWYHRGQIAMLLRSIGAEPAVTDLIFWAREPVDERFST